jgi:hypothetical protein
MAALEAKAEHYGHAIATDFTELCTTFGYLADQASALGFAAAGAEAFWEDVSVLKRPTAAERCSNSRWRRTKCQEEFSL